MRVKQKAALGLVLVGVIVVAWAFQPKHMEALNKKPLDMKPLVCYGAWPDIHCMGSE